MDPKLLEVVVENVAKKFLHDEDEAKLVSKLMLKVLREEATVDEVIRGRSVSASKLSEYVEAARLTLKRFDASVDEAVSQVRRSSTGRGQLQTDDSDDEVIIIQQKAVDKAQPTPLVSAVHRAPLSQVQDENDSEPPKKKACKPTNQRRTSASAASVPVSKKLNVVEPKHAKTDEELISEFDIPDVEVLIDDDDLLPSPTVNSEAMKQPATTDDHLGASEAPPSSRADVNDGNNNVLQEAPATEKMSMKYSTLADGTLICEHCKQTFKKLGGLSAHYLRRHAPDEDVFICEQCGAKCSTQAKLQRHMRLKHSEANTSAHTNEPSASSLPGINVGQNQATAPVPGTPIDDPDKSSTTGWLLAMCNVTVKKELIQ